MNELQVDKLELEEIIVYNDHVEVTFNMAFSFGKSINYTYVVSKLIHEFW